MTAPDPFAYPTTLHSRRHDPGGYTEYQGYKPWLRDEFAFRCVYCLQRETWSRAGHAAFSVDHVVPQSEAPELACDYRNLVYACLVCNSARQAVRVVDPTREAMAFHISVRPDGTVAWLTEEGAFLVDLLHLNSEAAVKERRRILRCRDRYLADPSDRGAEDDFQLAFGYPEDMPDLTALRPPSGNSLAANCDTCHFARHHRHELPKYY